MNFFSSESSLGEWPGAIWMQENKGNNINSVFSFSEEVCCMNFLFNSVFPYFPEINVRLLFLTRKKYKNKKLTSEK